ncbi:hypothetical protein NDU88_003539 [Pleurodeles waltl]|uniref:Uncharacterized protein n=1 Tax=Pleurodeles waltl TaxID=8319 RepID=A0AAV7NJJ3_PLEWA|nr:hypothetical protein NDU88_003539 [Pleurodeles waltl]
MQASQSEQRVHRVAGGCDTLCSACAFGFGPFLVRLFVGSRVPWRAAQSEQRDPRVAGGRNAFCSACALGSAPFLVRWFVGRRVPWQAAQSEQRVPPSNQTGVKMKVLRVESDIDVSEECNTVVTDYMQFPKIYFDGTNSTFC